MTTDIDTVTCYAGGEGVRRSELVDWYLKEIEQDIETIEELTSKKILVEKIIERLMHHVSAQD